MYRKAFIASCVAAFLGVGAASAIASQTSETYGIGRSPAAAEIEAWDIDVSPDGTGLPPGSGTVSAGARLYAEKCAACHGPTGSEGPYETLVGTESLSDQIKAGKRPKRTIGNLWPSAPVLFDYIGRTMPFNEPGSLNTAEIYSVVAWLLHQNGVLPDATETVDAAILTSVKMPGAGIFGEDPRRPWLLR